MRRPQPVSDDRFVTTDRGLDQGSFSVAGRDLPLHSAISVDRRNVSVSLARRIGVRPFHRIGAWRNDHDSTGTVPGDGVIGRIAVIGAIGRELATARRALRRLPGRQCLRCHPKRQTSAPTKACLVFRPVRDLELHLANAMAAGGIVLERHRDEDRLLRLPITYDNAINDPRTMCRRPFGKRNL